MSSGPHEQGMLDTNILILRRWIDPADLPDEMAISAVTLAELDAEAARIYGRVSAAVIASGRKPGRRMVDLMIAAAANRRRSPAVHYQPGGLQRTSRTPDCRAGHSSTSTT